MSQSNRVIVYLCRVKRAEQLISRHHIAALATCEKVGEVGLGELPETYAEVLRRKGEVLVTSCDEAKKVFLRELKEGEYLRLVLTGS